MQPTNPSQSRPPGARNLVKVTAALACLLAVNAESAILSWSGGGANNNWSDSGNWGFAGTPANGDTLIFPAAQPRLNNTNNLGALVLDEVRFVGAGGGYTIYGGALTVTNRIQATNTAGANSLFNNLVITPASLPINVSNGVSLTFGGSQTGAGGFVKNGTGTLTLDGPNNVNDYAGDTVVNEGLLQLSSQNVIRYGTLVVGDGVGGANADVVRNLISSAIYGGPGANSIRINSSGLLDLNNFNDEAGPIVFNGAGNLTTGTGTLSLVMPITKMGTGSATFSGNAYFYDPAIAGAPNTFFVTNNLNIFANLSGAPIEFTKTGPGTIQLHGTNTYSGLTVVQQGFLSLYNGNTLGDTASGTVVSNKASLVLFTAFGVTNESLTLNGFGVSSGWGALDSESAGTNFWTGPISLNATSTITAYDSPGVLRLSGVISGPGGLIASTETGGGIGTVMLEGAGANTYAGSTTVNGGTLALNKSTANGGIPGKLVIGNGSGGVNADVVRLLSGSQIADVSDVQVNSSGLLDLGTTSDQIDKLSGIGNVTFGVGGFMSVGANNGSSTFDGLASGTGFVGGYTIRKTGSGTFTLNGNNTHLNQTRVDAGTLIINGSQPQSPLRVIGGLAGGSGTVGNISCDADLAPGNSPGCLTSSNLVFSAAADFFAELAGTTPCSGHDQLIVRGTTDLGSATLHVVNNFPPGKPNFGDQFVIIDNDDIDVITGTFNGLANGATFNVGDIGYRINYNGGTGNDVVLTVLYAPGATVTINATDRGWYRADGYHDPTNPNYLVGEQASGTNVHDWFVFNIPQFSGTVVQAELLINTYSHGGTNDYEIYVLRHVATAIGTLVAGGSGLTAIYNDLADGPVYSVRNILEIEDDQRAIIPLNLTFINDATAAAGGQIALGGSLANLIPGTVLQTCFGFSGSPASDVQLRLTFGTATLLNASDRGWYNQSGNHGAANVNYFAGEFGGVGSRNFFVFDLPALSGSPFSAHLLAKPYDLVSPTNFVNYTLRDVSTPISTLTNSATGATATYADLGTGNVYGSRNIYSNELPAKVSVPLNGLFTGAAFANSGGQIALGGSLILDPALIDEYLFGTSHVGAAADDVQLWLGFLPATLPVSAFASGSPTHLGGNNYQFTLTGTTGTTNEIQTSTDFVNWDVVTKLSMTNASVTFNYANTLSNRFFRARLVQ
jgi:autotransporter-associated beta strand protein